MQYFKPESWELSKIYTFKKCILFFVSRSILFSRLYYRCQLLNGNIPFCRLRFPFFVRCLGWVPVYIYPFPVFKLAKDETVYEFKIWPDRNLCTTWFDYLLTFIYLRRHETLYGQDRIKTPKLNPCWHSGG